MAHTPSYVAYYGMQTDPFSDLQEPPFINVGGRQQAVDSVLHLLSYSEDLVFVSGPSASGKSRLLDQLVRQLDTSIDLAVVDVDECGSEKELLWELASQFGLDPDRALSTEGLQERIAAHSRQQHAAGRIPTIAIDDVDQLPLESLSGLAGLLHGGVSTSDGLRLIGLASDTSEIRREMAALGFSSGQVIELPPLSFDDALHLIQGYFHAAGVRSGVPLEEGVLARLHRISDGRPGAFIDGVRDHMLVEAQRRRRRFALPWPHVLAGVAVLVVLAVALLYQTLETGGSADSALAPDNLSGVVGSATDNQNGNGAAASDQTPSEPIELTQGTDADASGGDDTAGPPASTLDEAVTRANDVRARLDAALAERATGTEEPARAPEPTGTRPPLESASTPTAPATVDASEAPEPDTTPSQAETAAESTGAGAAPETPNESPLYAPDWLRNASADHYTIQLVAARAESNVLEFAEESGLPDSELGYVAGELDGQPWYMLVYGNYDSPEAARTAINELTARVRTAAPWPRTIGSVQADLP